MSNMINSLHTPYFVAIVSATLTNVTGDGTIYSAVFNTLNSGSSVWFNTSTGVFTATQAGKYEFNAFIDFGNIGVQQICVISLVTTSKTYILAEFNPTSLKGPAGACLGKFSLTAVNMSLNDTAFVTLQVSGSTKTISFNNPSFFSGKRIS